jgi:membrane protein DedA with SNARE-associated domain
LDSLLQYGPLGCFVALLLTAFGLPIPEEISLLVLGALTFKGSNIVLCWMICFLGVLGGDSIAWYMGKKTGLEPTGFVRRLLGKKSLDDIGDFYEKYGMWAIVIARQIPGMRFPTFFFSGASGVSFWRFFLIDGTASMITVNLYFSLGFYFGDQLPFIRSFIEDNLIIANRIGLIAIFAIGFWIFRRKFLKK